MNEDDWDRNGRRIDGRGEEKRRRREEEYMYKI
jgi:hypothetical protein